MRALFAALFESFAVNFCPLALAALPASTLALLALCPLNSLTFASVFTLLPTARPIVVLTATSSTGLTFGVCSSPSLTLKSTV